MSKNPEKIAANKIESLKNELIKAKEELLLSRKNENEFREIVDNANSFIIKISTENKVNYVNSFAKNLFKKEYSQIIGKSLEQTLISGLIEGSDGSGKKFNKLFSKPKDYQSFISHHKTRKKDSIWVLWTMKPGYDTDGNFIEYTIIGNDISQTKQNEELILVQKKIIEEKIKKLNEVNEALSTSNQRIKESINKHTESELRFRIMSQNMPFGVFISNPDGENNYVNNFYCKLTGLKYNKALGLEWMKAIHPDDMKSVQKRWESALKKSPMNFNMIYKILNVINGKTYKIHAIAKEMRHEDDLIGYVGVIKDITKEERLISKSKNYELIIRNSTEMMSLISNNYKYLVVNDSYVQAHGLKKYEIEGKTFAQLWGDDLFKEKIKVKFDEAFTGKIVRYQDWFDYKHLGRKYMDVIYQPVYGNRGKVESITVNTLDITDLKETQTNLEKAIQEAERANKAKSEFLANMSHEIRTPLNAVIGFTELLESQITDNKQKKYLRSVKAGGRSLLTIINDILDLSKIEAGKMELHYEPVHINNLIDEISQIFSIKIEEKGLILETYTDPQLPNYILLDEIRLRQILFNLVGNAIKFTKQGCIKLSFKLINKEKETIDIEINVEDTGIGIPKDQLTEIFKAFKQQVGQSTRKYGGTGLGLTISRKLIESMNGKIDVKSELGIYTKFSIILNKVKVVSSTKSKKQDNIIDQYDLVFEKANILVIDKVKENRNLIAANFSNTALNIIPARDAKEAMKLIKTKKINLVILDVNLRDLKDCKINELVKMLSENRNTPIIAMSTSIINKEECEMEVDFVAFLSKPMKRNELIKTISKLLKHKKVRKKRKLPETGNFNDSLKSIQLKPNFPEIIKQIDKQFIPMWDKASRDELSDDIELFSKELKIFAEK
ncbi:MAG: hypothetical protein DRJ07_09460, partial [Bacteroidetes bacterium]